MRKALRDDQIPATLLTLEALTAVSNKGFKYFQVNGLTVDRHYDHIEPKFIILVPCKELPSALAQKGIFEPIDSELLRDWATDSNEHNQVYIAKTLV